VYLETGVTRKKRRGGKGRKRGRGGRKDKAPLFIRSNIEKEGRGGGEALQISALQFIQKGGNEKKGKRGRKAPPFDVKGGKLERGKGIGRSRPCPVPAGPCREQWGKKKK